MHIHSVIVVRHFFLR